MSDQAAEMFAEAVESCNPQLIREAVAQGAPVDRLSGRSVTPLTGTETPTHETSKSSISTNTSPRFKSSV